MGEEAMGGDGRAECESRDGLRLVIGYPCGATLLRGTSCRCRVRWEAGENLSALIPRLPFAGGTTYAVVQRVEDPADESLWIERGRLLRPATRRVFDRDLRLPGDDPLLADEVVLAAP